ncbi:MAG TPA: hypothetical protein VGJ77_06660 [Gaiellaceae bacterium]|jgi:hypothetical protein
MPPLASVPHLDRELDELYGLPLEEWTRARNDLAGRLKKAHQAEQAEQVRSLRKPSVVAWAVNQLARRDSKRVEALLRAGERLRAAQEQAMRGRAAASDVNAAARAERDAVRDLVAAARDVLEDAGHTASPATLDRVSQTLRAAAVDEQGRELLARGRFDEELKSVGFGTLTSVTPAAARPRTDELKAARERVKGLRAEARRLAAEAREAETEAARAERDAERARERAQEKREEADAAATKLADAEARLSPRR